MPNGNPKFREELPVLEAFFSQIADVLNQFASRHNLMLDKYYRESHSWRFNFRHPKGGVASIDVERESDDGVKLHGYWWLDDYDKFTRFLKHQGSEVFRVSDDKLDDLLENRFRQILSWELGEWTQIASAYEDSWKSMGKKFIQRDVERYPIAKV